MEANLHVRMPDTPECWQSCGQCATSAIRVAEILVRHGEYVERDTTLIVVDTGKLTLDIPSPASGRIIELFVAADDTLESGQIILTLRPVSATPSD